MKDTYKPGTDNVQTGWYQEAGPRGGTIEGGKRVEVKREGDRLPPTSRAGNVWVRE